MAGTIPTKKSIPSKDIRDLGFNSEKMDEVINSDNTTYIDRKGRCHLTIKGLEEAAVSAGPTIDAAQKALGEANKARVAAEGAAQNAASETLSGISNQVARAEEFADSAVDSANRAESAATSASIDAPTYDSISEGISKTSSGDYFRVWQNSATGVSFVFYKNNNGVGDELTDYPSAGAIDFIQKGNNSEVDWAVIDESDRLALAIKKDGSVQAGSLNIKGNAITSDEGIQVGSIEQVETQSVGISLAWVDDDDRIAIAINSDGSVLIPNLVGREPDAQVNEPVISADLMHAICYGQSLSVGSLAFPVISKEQKYNNVTFNSGVIHVSYNPYDMSDFKPLVEEYNQTGNGRLGESPVSGCVDTISALSLPFDGAFIGSAPGAGGLSIDELSKGSAAYTRLVEHIANGYANSQRKGLSYNVQFIPWYQGEQDNRIKTPRDKYTDMLRALQLNIYDDANKITGQKFVPPLISYQVSSHKYYGVDVPLIALAQLDATEKYKNIHIATPMYIFDYASDNLHLSAISSWLIGAYTGAVYKKRYLDNEEWTGVTIKHVACQGRIIDLHMNVPEPPLAIDVSHVSITKNYGFSIRTGDLDVVHDIIASVTISGSKRIRLTLSSDIPEGAHVCYAFGEPNDINGGGRNGGPRGNIRDSGSVVVKSPIDSEHTLHNWMLITSKEIK
ncbi:sialate O-acetylesterase [Providencia heimbachae]|uniref:sialate O-acetylesterase n=1 Tax=Providencia heimbachae TaxID=333962 RepID=UPI0008392668|nr:sialate O-acetylesterase [Providencia heimbachae]